MKTKRGKMLHELKSVSYKLLEWIVTGIAFAIAASILSSILLTHLEERSKIKEQLSNLSQIYIGCNKEWVDEQFGVPRFSGQKGKYVLCAYVSDFFVVQMAFDEANSAQAYLITALNSEKKINWKIDDSTLRSHVLGLNDGLILGAFSYYDFPGSPISVFGFVSNGNARALYAESYYFMSSGNYYDYYIATFDFGKLNGQIEDFLAQFTLWEDDLDDEVGFQYKTEKSPQVIADRKNNFPNTYGVSAIGIDVDDLFFSYDWFNSQQLRNRLNNKR